MHSSAQIIQKTERKRVLKNIIVHICRCQYNFFENVIIFIAVGHDFIDPIFAAHGFPLNDKAGGYYYYRVATAVAGRRSFFIPAMQITSGLAIPYPVLLHL
jgi:hypothetical protein